MPTPRYEEIAARAYELFLARGGAHGHHEEDWLRAENELSTFSVVLSSAGENKIGVVKELRMITGGSLERARDLAESTPSVVAERATRAEAEAIRQRLASVGARIEVR